MTETILAPMAFISRIQEYTLAAYHFGAFFKYADLRERIINHRMQEFDELTEQYVPEEYRRELYAKLQTDTHSKVDAYLPMLYNQALVMIVTVFDVYLYESLKIVIDKHPHLLKSMADEKDISIVEIIDKADYQAIFETIRDRVLRKFDFKSMQAKVDALRKLRVDIDAALNFQFHTAKVQQRYTNSLRMLHDYYEKRHAIVHREQHTFDSYEQLEEASQFFGHLVWSLGHAIGFRFNIMTDWEKMAGNHPKRPVV